MQPARIPSSSEVGSTAPTATASSTPATKPAKMPTPPKSGVALLVPALPGRLGDEPVAEVGAQERPEDESRDGQGRERDDRAHERKA